MSTTDHISSFYIPAPDELIEHMKSEPERTPPTSEEIFLREISQLNDRGPFIGEEGRIALRAFSYKDVTLFGFLVEETSDAFMVMLPASLARDDAGVKATQVIASPIARLMKSSVGIMSLPTPVQTLYYLSLTLKQHSTCPGYFTTTRTRQVTNLVGLLKIALGVEATPSKPASATPKPTFQVPDSLVPRVTH